ncbi:MAG: 16S rRNA (cytosine(1402)-N(4))-methyltransferase RsmH [Methylophilaceae bacterium]
MMRGATQAPTTASVSQKSDQASSHTTVLLDEAVEALNIKSNGTYVDCTFGRGGHSQLILERLGDNGRLFAIDRDLMAYQTGQSISDRRFHIEHLHFSEINQLAANNKLAKVDGILLDLGISSPQVDESGRGFSFRLDGPLDMRMDQTSGETAAELLATISEQKLREVIKDYGEERFAKQVARAIIKERTDGRAITTTGQLAKIVASAIPKVEPGKNPATRTFQALRIFVNQELEELSLVLPKCLDLLVEGGRLVVISFHSLEDRIVKQFIKREEDRDNLPSNFPVKAKDLPQARLLHFGKAVKPTDSEIKLNPRARSAVMRVAVRTAVQ